VIVLDANILLYAFDRASTRHDASRRWLESALGEEEVVGFPLVTILAFLRIGTDPRVFADPYRPEEAVAIVRGWLDRPNTELVQPTSQHWKVLPMTIEAGRATGPLIMDAHLATLAREHGATLCTTDRDFARFRGLRTIDPTA
jgi:uncharacterized protein